MRPGLREQQLLRPRRGEIRAGSGAGADTGEQLLMAGKGGSRHTAQPWGLGRGMRAPCRGWTGGLEAPKSKAQGGEGRHQLLKMNSSQGRSWLQGDAEEKAPWPEARVEGRGPGRKGSGLWFSRGQRLSQAELDSC